MTIDIKFIEKNIKSFPIQYFLKKYNCTVPELTSLLRKKGIIHEVEGCEIDYILKYCNTKPLKEIQEELYLTDSQFAQIRSRYKIGTLNKNIADYTEEEVIEKTKYLIEQKLKLDIDDMLPKVLTLNHFSDNDCYGITKYATIKKKEDSVYKYFSSIAYLCELSYPGIFKPYQFNLTKEAKSYFTKRRYLYELIDIMENKLGYDLENIEQLVKSNNFLNRKELQFYGLGSNLYKEYFKDKKELLSELAKVLRKNTQYRYEKTDSLKLKLIEANINPDKCHVEGCKGKKIEIHHIRAKRFGEYKNIDEVENLIPLCAYHHDLVYEIEPSMLGKDESKWREIVLNYIQEK